MLHNDQYKEALGMFYQSIASAHSNTICQSLDFARIIS